MPLKMPLFNEAFTKLKGMTINPLNFCLKLWDGQFILANF